MAVEFVKKGALFTPKFSGIYDNTQTAQGPAIQSPFPFFSAL